ncbi:MAG: phage major capsid protein [Chthoniobacterales bacterium]
MRYFLLLTFLTTFIPLQAQQTADPAVTRLRETLKSTMLQLRSAQTDLATAQSDKAAFETEKQTLTDQVATLTKQAIADKDASTKSIEELQSKVAAQEKEITAQKEAIAQWKVALEKMTSTAQSTEAARAKLAARVIVLDRQVADQKLKNTEMYKIGSEVLTRYEKFGLGDALTAREPFVGLTRVKFENLVQDYSDKLKDQTIRP